jgi:exoribonuclease-2
VRDLDFVGKVAIEPESFTYEDKDTPIEYVVYGRRYVGIIQRPMGRRHWAIVNQQGKEEKINKYQLSFQWPKAPVPLSHEQVRAMENEARQLAAKFDEQVVEKIWKDLVQQGVKLTSGHKIAPIIFPNEEIDSFKAYVAHSLLASHPLYFFTGSRGTFEVKSEEELASIRVIEEGMKSQKLARKAFVEKLRMRLNILDGKISEQKIEFNKETDPDFMTELKSYALKTSWEVVDPTISKDFLEPLGFGARPLDAFHLLSKLGIWHPLENPHVLRFIAFPLAYPEDAIQTANNIIDDPYPDPDKNIRRDLTTMPVFAIDNNLAHTDVDDAISLFTDDVGDDWLYIHVSDPTRYIQMGDPLDKLARLRCSSIFLPDRTFHMLPGSLSEELLSILPGKQSSVLTFSIKLSPDGSVERYFVTPSLVENVHRLTYEELDNILFNKPINGERLKSVKANYLNVLKKFEDMARRRRLLRSERGAVFSNIPRPDIKIDHEKGDAKINYRISHDFTKNSRGIITEFMLLAGEVAADFLFHSKVPGLFRTQPRLSKSTQKNTSGLMQEDIDESKELMKRPMVIVEQMENSKGLGPMTVTAKRSIHQGLGLSGYCQVTSPLRRYGDLINHYQIKSVLRKELAPVTEFDMIQLIPGISNRLADIQNLQRLSERFWVLQCIDEQVKTSPKLPFKAFVMEGGDAKSEINVMLLNFGLQVKMMTKRPHKKSETIEVIVKTVEPFYDVLVLEDQGRWNVVNKSQ